MFNSHLLLMNVGNVGVVNELSGQDFTITLSQKNSELNKVDITEA